MKPILFSTEQVQAILEGRKTMTRRVIKNIPEGIHSNGMFLDGATEIKCPYQPGDILWVRETWYYEEHMHELTAGDPDLPSGRYKHRYIYKASDPDYPVDVGVGDKGWRPSIFMPKEAARIFLEVTNVRVERLQEITEEDARAEGVFPAEAHPHQHRDAFADLWDSINLKRGFGWETNPWVWVISFMRTEEDA